MKRASDSHKRINPDFQRPQVSEAGDGAPPGLDIGKGYSIAHSKATSNMSGINEFVEGQNFILSSANRMFDVPMEQESPRPNIIGSGAVVTPNQPNAVPRTGVT